MGFYYKHKLKIFIISIQRRASNILKPKKFITNYIDIKNNINNINFSQCLTNSLHNWLYSATNINHFKSYSITKLALDLGVIIGLKLNTLVGHTNLILGYLIYLNVRTRSFWRAGNWLINFWYSLFLNKSGADLRVYITPR